MEIEIFKQKAIQKHGQKYDYSLIQSDNVTHKDKVSIICPDHGTFEQSVNSHLLRSGCPLCGKTASSSKRMKQRQYYIDKASTIHDNKYEYTLLPQHPKATDKVSIICPEHGMFNQQLNDHLQGHGCNKCARKSASEKTSKGLQHFVERCQLVHGDKYNYENILPTVRIKDKVTIHCTDHGDFEQVLDAHLAGSGCPKCSQSNHSSQPEKDIREFCDHYNIDYIPNDRTTIPPKELDLLIPSHSLAIEYCGLYWHSETQGKHKQYHAHKMKECNNKGIRLLTIFEDEWTSRKDQVKHKLKRILGVDDGRKIYARKCTVGYVDTNTKREFFNINHIQGDGHSSINLGLIFDGDIVAIMGFTKHHKTYTLTRFATNSIVVGGFSKLLTHFQREFDWEMIISFADLRWSEGETYHKTGWKLDSILPPDYSYIKGYNRYHKFNFRRKRLQKLLNNFDPSLSEKQNCDNNGILRIWDCGKQRWVIENS